nr:zinc finger, CCHC-type [Tanacetum cinerariifolium]
MKVGVPGQDGAEGNAAKRYRGDNNMAALGVAAVIEEYAHESLTFRDAVACEVISKWISILKEDMDTRSSMCMLSNSFRRSNNESNIYYLKYAPVPILLGGHSTLSLEGGLSGNHDEEKKSGLQSEVPALVEAVTNRRRLTIITKAITYYRKFPDDAQNKNPSTETRASDSTILSKPAIKFVKAADKATKRPTTDKVKTAKKPTVKYAKLYRKPSKKPTVKGEPKELEQSEVSTTRSSPKNSYTHRSMPPKLAIHRPYRTPMRTTKPNLNVVTRPYVNSTRPQTTQELMIILIQGVQRLEKELKARNPVHKVDRGRSRPVMAWVPKKV